MTGFREKCTREFPNGENSENQIRKTGICEKRITRAFNRGRTHSNENATAYLSLSALDKAKWWNTQKEATARRPAVWAAIHISERNISLAVDTAHDNMMKRRWGRRVLMNKIPREGLGGIMKCVWAPRVNCKAMVCSMRECERVDEVHQRKLFKVANGARS